MPLMLSVDIQNRLYQNVYLPLVRANRGAHWSAILNCQTLTKLSVQILGYEFPHDIKIMSDISPTLFDIHVKGNLITAQICSKSNC